MEKVKGRNKKAISEINMIVNDVKHQSFSGDNSDGVCDNTGLLLMLLWLWRALVCRARHCGCCTHLVFLVLVCLLGH